MDEDDAKKLKHFLKLIKDAPKKVVKLSFDKSNHFHLAKSSQPQRSGCVITSAEFASYFFAPKELAGPESNPVPMAYEASVLPFCHGSYL